MPTAKPRIAPTIINRGLVPARRSSQYPPATRSAISKPIVIIRVDHSSPMAMGDRSLEDFSVIMTPAYHMTMCTVGNRGAPACGSWRSVSSERLQKKQGFRFVGTCRKPSVLRGQQSFSESQRIIIKNASGYYLNSYVWQSYLSPYLSHLPPIA